MNPSRSFLTMTSQLNVDLFMKTYKISTKKTFAESFLHVSDGKAAKTANQNIF